jgi:hypothetical protein
MKHFINAFGEELIIDNTDKAVAIACEKTGAIVKDYTAAPVYFSEGGNGSHEWLIAFDRLPTDINAFIFELDQALKTQNSDYEAKRYKDIALTIPLVIAVAPDAFEKWLTTKGKLGGQHKVPRLSNDRQTLEEIKSHLRL